jgi:hypothetical protein
MVVVRSAQNKVPKRSERRKNGYANWPRDGVSSTCARFFLLNDPLLDPLQADLQCRRCLSPDLVRPLHKCQCTFLLWLTRQIARDIGPNVSLPDRPGISERPTCCNLAPFGALRNDDVGRPPVTA